MTFAALIRHAMNLCQIPQSTPLAGNGYLVGLILSLLLLGYLVYALSRPEKF